MAAPLLCRFPGRSCARSWRSCLKGEEMLTRALFLVLLICGIASPALAEETKVLALGLADHEVTEDELAKGPRPFPASIRRPSPMSRPPISRRATRSRSRSAIRRSPAHQQRDAGRGQRRPICCKRASGACRPAAGRRSGAISPRSRSRATARPLIEQSTTPIPFE